MTAFNPTLAAQLCEEAEEDDRRMTEGPWGVYQDSPFDPVEINSPSRDVAALDTWEHRPDERESEAHAIARTRNNLRDLAEQLRAAVAEVERLTKERDEAFAKVDSLYDSIEAGTAHKTAMHFGNLMLEALRERDAARAECERMRAVYEAAVRLHRYLKGPDIGANDEIGLFEDAIDAALTTQPKERE